MQIQVTNSCAITIDSNTVSGCDHGIVGMAVGYAANPDYTTGRWALKALGIHVSRNHVTQLSGTVADVRTTGTGADTAFTWGGGSAFVDDAYSSLSWSTSSFTWDNANKTAAQWKAIDFEATGSFAP